MIKSKENKLTNYVNKYDYIHYYTRCSEVAFLSNFKIEQLIDEQLKQYQKYLKNKDDLSEDETDDLTIDIDAQDAYCIYRETIFDNHIDKQVNRNKNPKTAVAIVEGRQISALAKEFLIKQYNPDVVIDYDDKKYEHLQTDDELAFIQTKTDLTNLLNSHQSFILFQPTFINETSEHVKFVTKCDCLVYLNKNQCYLIQIRGTSSSRLIHYLDLLYQHYALKNFQELKITNYYLCLAKYCRAVKNTIPFIIDPYINFAKSAPIILKDKLPTNEADLIALRQRYKLGKDKLLINDLLANNLKFNELYEVYKSNGCSNKNATLFATMLLNKCNELNTTLNNSFNEVINNLSKQKERANFAPKILKLLPCANCKSKYQNCIYWTKCKELFKDKYLAGQKQYYPFLFAGSVFERFLQFKAYEEMNTNHSSRINSQYIKPEYQCFLDGKSNINAEALKDWWAKLQSKPKKVYFTLATLNTAIRCLDNTFPFNQVVVQCSISKIIDDSNEPIEENLIVDPQQINLGWLKQVINHLYESDDCWYVVYNKSFEVNRLQEIAQLLNDEEMNKKITGICNNLFELSAFFTKNPKAVLLEPLHGYYSLQAFVSWLATIKQNQSKKTKWQKIINSSQANVMFANRFFKQINDAEWNSECIDKLQQYGAFYLHIMQAIEQYLNKLITDLNTQIKDKIN